MKLQSYLLTELPVLELGSPYAAAVHFFADSVHTHVAVVDNGRFVGVLDRDEVDALEVMDPVTLDSPALYTFSVSDKTMWLDVLEVFAREETNLVPVIDGAHRVLGYYQLADLVTVFLRSPFFTEPGGILVLATGLKDYSFSEIAQIVEGNNARLIGGGITDVRNDIVQVTIKINRTDLNDIMQTFRRYHYTILFGNADDLYMEELKSRSEYLSKYLNV